MSKPRTRLGVRQERLFKLTASNSHWPSDDGDPHRRPLEAPAQWPTYENMVCMFRQLGDAAAPGDQVYMHYPGHGGRATTAYTALKGNGAFDEPLVPTDIGHPSARCLSDVELADLVQTVVD